jgi:hypothetical protein
MNSETLLASKKLNLFYEEPEGDRWLPLDRYPRRIIRRIVRGPRNPGGMERYFLNLVDGLRRIGMEPRINDFRHARNHPDQVVGIIGKSHLLRERKWRNPIIFGPAVPSHPTVDPNLINEAPIRRVLVSCEWMKTMYDTIWPEISEVWASGIDTSRWKPVSDGKKTFDVLVYDKIRWDRDMYEEEFINPILACLKSKGLNVQVMRYGAYREDDYEKALRIARSMVFLCEHETQGFAYLQALSCGVPILAWDRGGYWQDPEFYPDQVKFWPVSSVPYWDDRCGVKFGSVEEFPESLNRFMERLQQNDFSPRDYILENLTLEKCAQQYVDIVGSVASSLS